MTTTISRTSERSYPKEAIRSRGGPLLGGGRTGGIERDLVGVPHEEAFPAQAFVAGAKAIVPVLLALLPFGLAFGATATGSGLSAVEALGMSVFVFAGAAQL